MPILWDDPFFEKDLLKLKAEADAKFKSYQDFFKSPIGEQKGLNIIDTTTAFPGLGKTVATQIGMTVDNPAQSQAVQDINEEYVLSNVAEEAALWKELSEKHATFFNEGWEMNMAIAPIEFWTLGLARPGKDGVYKSRAGRSGLQNAKFGDIQYGVWAAQAWDGLMQNIGLQGKWTLGTPAGPGRSWRYLADLMAYDYYRINGKSPKEAQDKLSIDVRYTEVEDVGKWEGLGGQLSKYIDMFQEAHNVGGQTIINAMWKEMHAGRPINFDRDKWMQFITLKPEDDPRYRDLVTIHGYQPEQAKDIFYRYVGRPLKAEEKEGEMHYTSLDNPARIYFYAGRRSHWALGWQREKFNSLMGRDPVNPNQDRMLFSPGRHQASFVAPVGTKAFRNASGTIDFMASLGSELVGGKGTKGLGNLFKNLRRINPLLDAGDMSIDLQKGRKITLNDAKSQADEKLEAVGNKLNGDGIDALPDNYNEFIDGQTGLWNGLRSKVRHYRIASKDRREYTAFGFVPKVFRETKEDLISSPFQMKLYQSIIDTVKDFGSEAADAYLKTNAITKTLHDGIHQDIIRHAKKQNVDGIKKIWGDLIDTGISKGGNVYHFPGKMLPRGAAYFRNKVSREMFKAGRELIDQPNASRWQTARGKALMSMGNEQAAYKSIGANLGVLGRTVTQGVIPSVARVASKAPGAVVKGVGVGLNALMRPTTVRAALNKKGFRLFLPKDEVDDIVDTSASRINPDFLPDMADKLQEGIVDELRLPTTVPFEKYLGFSSNLYSNTNPYMRSIMAVTPDFAIKGLNKQIAYEQLVAHMTVSGYDAVDIGARLAALRKTDWRKKSAVNRFLLDQAEMDIAMVRRIKGEDTAQKMEKEIAEQFNKEKEIVDLTGYFINKEGQRMGHAGNAFTHTEVQRIPDHTGQDTIIDTGTGHLFSEFADNLQSFVDYRIIRRALGPVYTQGSELKSNVVQTFTKGIWGNSKEWAKYHYNWWDVDSAITPKMTGVIHTKKFANDWLTRMADHYTRRVFKPLVLLRGAFLTRVFLEEQMRFVMGNLDGFFSHPIHYIQWVTSGKKSRKLNIDAVDIDNLTQAELDSLKLMQSFEHFEAVQKGFTLKGLLGRDQKATQAYNFYRVNKKDINKYTSALSFELLQLRQDPLARLIAKHGHANPEIRKWLNTGAGQKYLQDVADWGGRKWSRIVHDEDFQNQHIQSIEARIRMKTGGDLESGEYFQHARANDRYRYNIMSNRGASGSNQGLIDFIATGDLADLDTGKLVTFIPDNALKGELTKTNLWRGNKNKLETMLKRYVDSDTNIGPTGNRGLNLDMGELKYADEVEDKKKLGAKYDTWVNHLFTHLMTKPIGYLNRSTAFKQYRYQYLLANWENIQAPARKRFIAEAEELGVPKKIIQEMHFLSDSQKVSATAMPFDLANNASRAFGLTGTKNLLYDASKKHLISDITRNIFPFPEIWFEVAQTWGKLLADKPYALRHAHVAVRAGENYMTDGSTQRSEGFFAPNPQNKDEKMFVWPFSGFLSSLVYGGDLAAEEGMPQEWTTTHVASKAYLSGINLLGQGFVPGPNPAVAFALDKVSPITGWSPEIKDFLFGQFLPPTKVIGGVIPSPPWFKKLAAAMWQMDNDDELNLEFKQMRAASTIQVYRYGMITGQNIKLYKLGDLDVYLDEIDSNWSENDVDFEQKRDEAFLLYSKRKAGQLFAFQALAQFILPTGFQPTYYVQDVNGKSWHASVLADEYRKILLDNDNNDTDAAEDFINLYGLEHGWLTAPSKTQKGGRASYSYRAAKWRVDNEEDLKTLKLTAWLVLPENPAEQRATSDLIPEKTQLTADEFRRNVNDTIGYFRYQHYQRQLENLNLTSTQEIIAKRWFRNELILQLPGFQEDDWGLYETVSSKDMFREMRLKWLDNDLVMSLDTGKGFALMMQDWVEFENMSAQLSPTRNPDWWLQSTDERAVYMRMLANSQAQAIIKEYPEFFHVWTSVMLKLFRDDKELLMEMGINE